MGIRGTFRLLLLVSLWAGAFDGLGHISFVFAYLFVGLSLLALALLMLGAWRAASPAATIPAAPPSCATPPQPANDRSWRAAA